VALPKYLNWLAFSVAALCAALLAVRVATSISLAEPLHVQTSGAEYESLYGVWRRTQGQPVHIDRYQPPYVAVMYNWLFYQAYGTFTKAALAAFALAEAWLPTIARLLTLIGVAAGTAVAYAGFARAAGSDTPGGHILALAFAVAAIAGPLIGFWAVTVRPDVWAMTFEIAGALLFLYLLPKRRSAALAAVAAAAYLAWAMKQSNVSLLVAVGLFLMVRRAWRELAAMVVAMALAFAMTFAAGSPQYVKNVLFVGYPLDYSFDRGLRNIANFAIKSAPGLALLLGAVIARGRSRRVWAEIVADDAALFAGLGAAVSGGLALLTCFQVGGAENYFFTFAFFAVLAGFALMPRAAHGGWTGPAAIVVSAGWLVLGAAVTAVLAGAVGVTDLREQHRQNLATKRCVDPLPRPIFVNNPFMALPWLTPAGEHFILSYVYDKERRLGRAFGGGGLGGYVGRGHFRTIVLGGDRVPERLDGASLAGYRTADVRCPGLTILQRR